MKEVFLRHGNIELRVFDYGSEEIGPQSLPARPEWITPERYALLITLLDALVDYHNAPILFYQSSDKATVLALPISIQEYLNTSKIRHNHVIAIGLLIRALTDGFETLTNRKMQSLVDALFALLRQFSIQGARIDQFAPEWSPEQKLELARTINPHIRKFL